MPSRIGGAGNGGLGRSFRIIKQSLTWQADDQATVRAMEHVGAPGLYRA